ncbi:MAG: hypothetical protein ABJB74_13845, partial [Gemmatimonas sp.]
ACFVFRLITAMLVPLVHVSAMGAQVDPRGNIRTLRTAHFRVHYPVALDSLARRSAMLAEGAWNQLAKTLVTPAVPVDLLLQDNVDLSNGFAQTFPTNRITIYAVPPVAVPELTFHDEWLRLVITHELTHIFHLDRAGGIWRVGRYIFGRSQSLFPNSFLPRWITEGLAVHYESALTGTGRIVSTEFRTVQLAAAHSDDIHGPDAWSASTSRYPGGQTVYAWGSLLMHREATLGGDSSMRKFIDQTATFPIPFLLNRSAKKAFGKTFFGAFADFRDSLQRANAALDKSDDKNWVAVVPGSNDGNWDVAYPTWRSDDTLEWTASNGREPPGYYRVTLPDSESMDSVRIPERLARRNSLDGNAVGPKGTSVFSQYDFSDLYTIRNDLYRRDSTGDHRITHNARLIQPDVRLTDGAIIAVQLTAGGTRLVRVNGSTITPLTNDDATEWAEPRWDPTFQSIAAVQLLKNGVHRIVLLDTLGTIVRIVAESRAVLLHPTFVANSVELMWACDRTGRMQLEIADIGQAFTRINLATAGDGVMRFREQPFIDTLWRAEVRSASNVSSGIYQPSVSPDGLTVAALMYRNNGYVLVVGPVQRDGDPVKNSWYPANGSAPNNDSVFTGKSAAYRPWRQLLPHYWSPQIAEARDGGSNYGASTSASDILERHSYDASVLVNPRNGETNGNVTYRYAGFGVPTVTLSASQDWDATFRIVDSVGTTLGPAARRLQYVSASLDWTVPHIRWSASYSLGAQYERRHYTSEVDSVLGPPGSALRTGTRYPSLFVSGSIGNSARGARGFSAEQGVAASGAVSVRKRDGLANSESWRGVGVLRAFQALPLPGYARHVLALRVAGGLTDKQASSEFNVGGVSGAISNLVEGISFGDPPRTFPVRGFAPASQRGMRALSGTAEYRAPVGILARGLGLFPLFIDRFSLNTFADAARAWCSSNAAQRVAALCEAPGKRDGWLSSAGAELSVDLGFQYDSPLRLRLGFAKPITAPGELSKKPAFFVTLGSFF